VAQQYGRLASCTDLYAYVARTGAARAIGAGGVDPTTILFVLAHGLHEQDLTRSTSPVVHVVLRNDDYTTFEIVDQVLREVFGLAAADATTTARTAHEHGRAIVGRLPLDRARDRIEAGRALARARGYPLWLGIEDC
jgi:ATP-dependent Clp protease adapter protein ClpS